MVGGSAPSSWYVRVSGTGVPWRATSLTIPANHVVYIVSDPPNTRASAVCVAGAVFHVRLDGSGLLYVARLDLRLVAPGGAAPDGFVVERGASLVLDACEIAPVAASVGQFAAGVRAEPPLSLVAGPAVGAVRLESTLVSGFELGVSARGLETVELVDSVFEECGVGAAMVECAELRVTNSHIEGGAVGLSLKASLRTSSGADWRIEDSRFVDNGVGVDLDLAGVTRSELRIARCEFQAPAWWEVVPTAPPRLEPRAGRLWDSVGVRTQVAGPPNRLGGPMRPGSAVVVVESSSFNRLTRGVEVRPSVTGRTLLDHNTFSHCADVAVRVEGNSAEWAALSGGPGPEAVIGPALIVSNSIFLGDDPQPDSTRGGIELPSFPPGTFDDTVVGGTAQSLFLGRNLFWGFSGGAWNRVFERVGGSTQERLNSGDHRHLGTPFSQLDADPVLARELSGSNPEVFDCHPMRSLLSPAVEAAFDFDLAIAGTPMLEAWGFPPLGTTGLYRNERPRERVMRNAPPTSIGAAEPAGWVEFPIYVQNIASWVQWMTTGVDQEVADHFDVITFPAGLLGAQSPTELAALTGDPRLDAWTLFQGARLQLLASAAWNRGLKVTATVTVTGPGQAVIHTVRGQGIYTIPRGYDGYREPPTTPERAFKDFVVEAAVEFLRQVQQNPFVSPVVAWWWMPEEVRPNRPSLPKEFALAYRLREAMATLPPPWRPSMSYQAASTGSSGGVIPVELSGGGAGFSTASPLTDDLLMDATLNDALWLSRFNEGVAVSGVPISVSRPAATDTPLSDKTGFTDTNQQLVGYSGASSWNAIAPAVDHLGFRVGRLDGLFPGNYVDRTLVANGTTAPPLLHNRIVALHRAMSIREARDNASFSLDRYSQALHRPSVHHMVELFANVYTYQPETPTSAGNPTAGRLWPETSTLAAHDLLIGLPHMDGVGLYVWDSHEIRSNPPTAPINAGQPTTWFGMSGNPLTVVGNSSNPPPHPGWTGYAEVLRLLKTELREFLVCGERDFDLGFRITSPALPADREVPPQDYGTRSGWVAAYPRLSHTVLRVRDTVLLLVTQSETSDPTTFEFCNPALHPGATAVQLLTLAGSSVSVGSGSWFTDTLFGVQARVYRITL